MQSVRAACGSSQLPYLSCSLRLSCACPLVGHVPSHHKLCSLPRHSEIFLATGAIRFCCAASCQARENTDGHSPAVWCNATICLSSVESGVTGVCCPLGCNHVRPWLAASGLSGRDFSSAFFPSRGYGSSSSLTRFPFLFARETHKKKRNGKETKTHSDGFLGDVR